MLQDFIKQVKQQNNIKEGAGRKVYIFNDYVLKIAKNKRGLKENQNEYYLYNNADMTIKNFLCPIIDFNGKHLLMRKAELINLEKFEKEILPVVKHIIIDLYNKYNIDDFDLNCHFNWGILNNKPVIIDYGYNYFGEILE